MNNSLKVFLALLLGFVAADAFAQGATSSLLTQYQVQQTSWMIPVLNAANTLFWLLAAIQFIWCAIKLTLERQDMQGFLAGFIHQLMWIGAFYALLINGPIWIPAIVNSFINIGRDVAAFGGTELYPGNVVGRGVEIAMKFLDSAAKSGFFNNPATTLVLVLAALVVVVSFCLIAAQMLVALVESYMVTTAGLLFLGFGGSKWTAPYVERFIGLAVSIGIKLFVLYLLVAVGYQMSNQWVIQVSGIGAAAEPVSTAFGIMGASLCFLMVCWQSPKLVSSMVGGSPQLTGGDLIGTTAAVASGGSGLANSVAGAVGYAAGRGGEAMTGSQAAAMGAVAATVATGGVGAAVGAATTSAASTGAASSIGSAAAGATTAGYVAPPATAGASGAATSAPSAATSTAGQGVMPPSSTQAPSSPPRLGPDGGGTGASPRAPDSERSATTDDTISSAPSTPASTAATDGPFDSTIRTGATGTEAARAVSGTPQQDSDAAPFVSPANESGTREAARAGDVSGPQLAQSAESVPPPMQTKGASPGASTSTSVTPSASVHDAARAGALDQSAANPSTSGFDTSPAPGSATHAARAVDRAATSQADVHDTQPKPGPGRRALDQLTNDAAPIPPTAPKLVDPSDE